MTLKEVKEAPKAENIETQTKNTSLEACSLFVSVAEIDMALLCPLLFGS